MVRSRTVVLALCFALASCAGTGLEKSSNTRSVSSTQSSSPSSSSKSAALAAAPSALTTMLRKDRVWIAGQPSKADFRALKAQGVVSVLNVRTDEEMADRAVVPFAEDALLQDLGMRYATSPLGGSVGINDHAIAALKQALAQSEGPVLLHCASGNRAGLVWAAWQIRELGRDPTEVMRELEPLGLWPLSIEKASGVPMQLQRKPAE